MGPTGTWTAPCQAHFQALVRDAHKSQGTLQFFGNTDNPSQSVQAEKVENQSPAPEANAVSFTPCDSQHHCVFEHMTHLLNLLIQQRMSLENNELFPSRPALS